jgi:exoribonuclease-2
MARGNTRQWALILPVSLCIALYNSPKMTHVLFEEDGGLKAGSVLSEAGSSLQVEHASGKRSKVKAAYVLLRFEAPAASEILPAAQAQVQEIDVNFLWECAPQDEFGFQDLALEYFGRSNAVEEASVLLCLQSSPIHFHRKGRGRFRAAPAETVRLALAAVERRRQQELAMEQLAQRMVQGELPDQIAASAAALLVKPDKQSLEYKALERACEMTHLVPERMLMKIGAFKSPRALHTERFGCEFFPRGTGFGTLPDPVLPPDDLPVAEAPAFSIDDSTTTEIDDALSVQTLPDGRLRVGVHIAAPALGIGIGDPVDLVARDRMSTVYMPGAKITMLPEGTIRPYSLDEGDLRPALSLYVDLDETGTSIVNRFSRIERVMIAQNLRHDLLDDVVTEAALIDPQAQIPFAEQLRALWHLTLALSAQRERVRGKPEPRFRTDFTFYVDGEDVRIVQRRRDAPLDRIVAEMMILANSEWGRMLADHATPGIYRSQQAGRVRMSTHPLAHQGLGVLQYTWSTSPLRRYVDLTNQRQIIALLAGQRAPYSANDADLFSIISAFDARHGAYGDHQTRMERFWCLRWVAAQGLGRAEAVVVRDDLVRLALAPLYIRLGDLPTLSPGRRIEIDILATDEIDLSIEARYIGTMEASNLVRSDGLTADEAAEAEFAEEG